MLGQLKNRPTTKMRLVYKQKKFKNIHSSFRSSWKKFTSNIGWLVLLGSVVSLEFLLSCRILAVIMDAFRLFGNRCRSDDKSKFFLTSCFHIFCCECLHLVDHTCSVCKTTDFTIDEIEPGLIKKTPKVASLFRKKT